MKLQHKIKIIVSDRNGNKKNVLNGTVKRLPQRILTFLFGEFNEILVLAPGQSVETVEIHEIKRGINNEQ